MAMRKNPTAMSRSIASRTALAMAPVTNAVSMRCRTTSPTRPTIIVPHIVAIAWRRSRRSQMTKSANRSPTVTVTEA